MHYICMGRTGLAVVALVCASAKVAKRGKMRNVRRKETMVRICVNQSRFLRLFIMFEVYLTQKAVCKVSKFGPYYHPRCDVMSKLVVNPREDYGEMIVII